MSQSPGMMPSFMSTPPRPTFQQRFVEKQGVPPEEFTWSVLRATVPPHARLLLPIMRFFSPGILAADYDLINQMALLTSRRQFSEFASERHYHPANQGFARKVLGVRVSIERLQRLVYATMRPVDGQSSAAPFANTAGDSAGVDPTG
jgi:hypothetical protein